MILFSLWGQITLLQGTFPDYLVPVQYLTPLLYSPALTISEIPSYLYLVYLLAYLLITVAVIRQKHDLFPVIGFSIPLILLIVFSVLTRDKAASNLLITYQVLSVLPYLAILIIAIIACIGFLPKCRKAMKICRFFPAVFAILLLLYRIFIIKMSFQISLFSILDVALVCAMLFTGLWAVSTEPIKHKEEAAVEDSPEEHSPEKMPSTQLPVKSAPQTGVADEIKTYKELLDSGVISQEEYDEKKKQLLGL